MANSIKRVIMEEGIVLEKIFKGETTEFKASDGRVVPAQPDRYILKCVSGEEFKKDVGYVESTILDYLVDKTTYDKAIFNAPVIVKYELSNFGAKSVSLMLKENK